MSLKRIELQGFKSFREKTIINFDNGYTCIVGPNGCGKSNVSDAIRWVLGEQSAKQLRGENMKGVIFSGTPKLPEMGYAEVTLVFDNSDHMFRTTYEEIAITRKIFRSKSDNYYFINHKPCLRKEIIELMRDTGAGKDSLNVIEQGAVTEIMKVKPEDRRHIFDEAAGIAQVKEEKKQNLKMLANTDQGIATLSARIEEMDKALAPLKRQVETYEKYVVLRNELRDLEYNMFIYKYENADSEKDALRQHIKELEEYLADQNRNLEESKVKIEKLTQEETENDAKLRLSLDQKETLKINRERASGDQREHKAKLDSMQQALANLTEALEQNKKAKEEAEIDLAEATQVLNAKREERLNLQVESDVVSANLDEVTMELAMSESDFEKSTEERFANMSKLGEVYASQAKGEAECDILRENISRYEAEIASCREQIGQKQKQIDQGKKQQLILSAKNDTIEQERKSRIAQINEARYSMSDLIGKIRNQEPIIQNKEISVQSLKNIIRDKKGYTKAVNYIVQAAKTNHEVARHFVGVVGDLFKVDDKYAEAVEVALGGATNHIVTNTQEDANFLINYLRDAGVGRITCMPLNRIKGEKLGFEFRGVLNENGVDGVAQDLINYDYRFEEVFGRLLGRIVVCDKFETAKYLDSKYRGGLKIVTLDGKLFDPSGTISGGSRRTSEELTLEKERQKLDELKAEHAKLVAQKEKWEGIIRQNEEYLQSSRDQRDELDKQYNEIELSVESASSMLSALEERIRDAEAGRALANARLNKVLQNLEATKNAGGAIESNTQNTAANIEKAKADKESKKAERDTLADRKNALALGLSAVAGEIATLDKDIKRFGEELSQAVSEISRLEVAVAQKQEEIRVHMEAKPTLVFSQEEETQLAALDEAIKVCDEQKTAIRASIAEQNKYVEVLNDRILLSSNDRTKDLGKIEKIDAELEQWTNKIMEDYGRTYDDIKDEKKDDFDHVHAPQSMATLRGRITSLGNINHEAKEQYAEMSGDREEAGKQLDDALKAKENIEAMLKKISEEMSVKFADAFQKINDNFQETFSDLFGGGKAELVLTDNPDDPDEQGVDISVQLPGKSKGPLSRLSGGEQSLTAIAILFAILKLKPMPFVVLDEVESALDEVNCNRFARFLRRYSNTSRFVVITHKKPTMEGADALFGVTMAQPGVSSVLSVGLKDAVKHVWED